MAKLEVKNLKQQYLYGTTGVNDLTFTVQDGSYVVLGGEESGKTSLFRVLAGKEAPFRGEALYDGVPLDKIQPEERSIVYVRERGGIFKLRTVEYNLAYPLKIRKFDRAEIEKRVTFALNLAGLTEVRRKRAGALGKFQQAKLKLARCFLRESRFYFIDEVHKNFVSDERAELFEILLKIKELDGVKVFAADDYEEAKTLADEGSVLYYGITEQTGRLSDFYIRPNTPEVFRLTHGEPSIEEGTIDRESGMITLKDKKIIVDRSALESFGSRSVLVVTAADGFTKIYNTENEKLIDFD